ncbi:MAG: NUDIX hydrolase [Rhodothermaceae bacterium]|nr:MAG: NUDIX hydrolase [Bacteroidota bacterium]GIV61362.1 MAG: NUDIX hydrolase [Rhodothermaceae bacterium]
MRNNDMAEVREKPVHPAATVLIVREGTDGLEVYMVRRSARMAFMPSMHVFPGGRVDEADGVLAARLVRAGRAGTRLTEGPDTLEDAAAGAVAAIREAAEECGLLLACDRTGRVPGHATARAVFEGLQRGEAFSALLRTYDLMPDLAALHPFARWVTPDFEARRYDTRFFLARAPVGQQATFDDRETTEGLWVVPSVMLDRFRAGDVLLAPPTLASLELLAGAGSVEAVLATIVRPIRPIHPLMVEGEDGQPVLALPGDPCYPGEAPPVLPHRTRFRVLGPGRFA